MKKNKLRIIPLGGLGEVGKNMMVYECNDEILIVDAGLMFPENDMLGIDYIIPDFEYLLDKRDKVRGIVITHGHEDHTGAIHHLLEQINAPIYATQLTRGLLEVKLARNGLIQVADLHTIHAGDSVMGLAWASTPRQVWWCIPAIINSITPRWMAGPLTMRSWPSSPARVCWRYSQTLPTPNAPAGRHLKR
jgi:mRNA degradation ribonuclease J1/J2